MTFDADGLRRGATSTIMAPRDINAPGPCVPVAG
jgi:hypothetical protein